MSNLSEKISEILILLHNNISLLENLDYVKTDNMLLLRIGLYKLKIKKVNQGFLLEIGYRKQIVSKISVLKKYIENLEPITILNKIISLNAIPLNIERLSYVPEIHYNIFDSKHCLNFFKAVTNTFLSDTGNLQIREQQKSIDCIEQDFLNRVGYKESTNVFDELKKLAKSEYLGVDTGDSDLDILINSIVKDNVITDAERIFLESKLIEKNYGLEKLSLVNNLIVKGNPYLDGLIHIILNDEIISQDEIIFLREKCLELDISKELASKRLWQICILYYPGALQKISYFIDFIKLKYLDSLSSGHEFRMSYYNFLGDINIGKLIEIRFKSLSEDFMNRIQFKKRDYKNIDLEKVLNKISFDTYNNMKKAAFNNNALNGLKKILEEEKRRIGSNDAELFCENIKFRLGL